MVSLKSALVVILPSNAGKESNCSKTKIGELIIKDKPEERKKDLQIQIGITIKHVSVDLHISNEGAHLYVDTLGDVSRPIK